MDRSSGPTRRDLLKHAALALPALAAFPRLALPALGEPPARERAATPRKVVVVGAGLAGLAAAWELARAGHEVTVLEARLRAGGRVHTLRHPFTDGLYAEAGAITFSDGYRHFLRYLQEFGLSAAPLPRPSLASVFHLRGRRLVVAPGAKPDWPYDLAPGEQGLMPVGLVIKYLGPAEQLGDPATPGWRPDAWKSWDAVTLADFLRQQGASDAATALLSDTLWWGHGWSTGSALHRLISDVALFYMGQKAQVIPGGSGLMVDAFTERLGERVLYGAPVVRIAQEAGRVRVVHRQGGAEQAIEADRLVCTAPVPLLRKIEWSPALPAAKRAILERLEYTPVTRLYLQSRRRFWADEGNAGAAATDLPIGLVAEHPFARPEGLESRRAVLECHAKGTAADRLAALDEEARLALAIENLEKVHPGFRRHVEGGTSWAWGADPWALGGYPEWRPGQLVEWVPELARPEGRVHFAGEHTSWLGRTTEGALESGNRAAREVAEAPP